MCFYLYCLSLFLDSNGVIDMRRFSFAIVVFFLCAISSVYGQKMIEFRGVVVDSETKQPLPSASVHTPQKSYVADYDGRLVVPAEVDEPIAFTHVGYVPKRLIVRDTLKAGSFVRIELARDTIMLSEVTARTGKLNYSDVVQKSEEEINWEIAIANLSDVKARAYAPRISIIDSDDAAMGTLRDFVSRQENEGMMPTQFSLPSVAINMVAVVAINACRRLGRRIAVRRAERKMREAVPVEETSGSIVYEE